MIFICVGSREYQFNRLLKEVDMLIKNDSIKDKVFAQIGQSTYIPKYFEYERYLSSDDFRNYQENATLVISHGGTGSLVGALKIGKQVIAVPRLAKFDEHIDNHQVQVSSVLEEAGYLRNVMNIKVLGEAINDAARNPITKTYSKPSNVLTLIKGFIENENENKL